MVDAATRIGKDFTAAGRVQSILDQAASAAGDIGAMLERQSPTGAHPLGPDPLALSMAFPHDAAWVGMRESAARYRKS